MKLYGKLKTEPKRKRLDFSNGRLQKIKQTRRRHRNQKRQRQKQKEGQTINERLKSKYDVFILFVIL